MIKPISVQKKSDDGTQSQSKKPLSEKEEAAKKKEAEKAKKEFYISLPKSVKIVILTACKS